MMTKSTTITMSLDDADCYPVGKIIPFRIRAEKTVLGMVTKVECPPDRNVIEVTFEFDEEIDVPRMDELASTPAEGH